MFSRGILIPVLVIALIGAGFWGYQENQEKNAILIKAENQYQRAFHDLNYHIDHLQDEIGKSLAVNSRKQLSPSLANVWRLSYAAQSDVGQLPLTLMPFSKTEEFLAKIADFSYRIAIRDLNREPLTDKEYQTLNSLYKQANEIQKELKNVQTKVIDKQLRWMDVETALSSGDKKADNTIVDGFKTIEKKVQEFPENDFGPGINSVEKKSEEKAKNLKGSLITSEQAKKIAAEFLDLKKQSTDMTCDASGKGSYYQVFSVSLKNEDTIYVDVTKTGGHIVWMLKNREIEERKISIEEAAKKAQKFLTRKGYPSMVANTKDETDGSVIFNFVYQQNGVLIYPDVLSVKVALDNGEIIGFQDTDYLFNHKQRTIPSPTITQEQAKTMVNPNLKIISIKQALIENPESKEILTYEITGSLNNNIYRIYINAANSDEEEVEKLLKDEIITF